MADPTKPVSEKAALREALEALCIEHRRVLDMCCKQASRCKPLMDAERLLKEPK